MAEAITIDGVSKAFAARGGAVEVLTGIHLRIEPGEFVAILGPSGCGKSTLLRLVGGLEAPTGGAVRIGDRAVAGVDPRCAVVFQEPRLFPWKTVAANVAVGGRRRRGAGRASTGGKGGADVAGLLGRVGLDGFGRAYPHQLSGGMAQRAALARGLAGRPEVLLLDEPFAALDALTRMEMQDLLVETRQIARPTVLMVTHDIDEALYLADRVIVLGPRPASVVARVEVPLPRPRDRAAPELLLPRDTILDAIGIAHPTRPAAPERQPGLVRLTA